MDDTSEQRAAAGLSLLFRAGQRPDADALEAALATCQASAELTRRDADAGAVEIVAAGLTFDCDGLAPLAPRRATEPGERYGWGHHPDLGGLEPLRIYPGPHLSGGLALAPVVRALLALAAELAVSLPVEAVMWHPAGTAIEPQRFSHTVLAWLAGGAFPAPGLVALNRLEDGSVISRGLAHLTGQEVAVRAGPQDEQAAIRRAAQIVSHLVQTGAVNAFTQWTIHGEPLCAEPAHRAGQVLVWRDEVQPA